MALFIISPIFLDILTGMCYHVECTIVVTYTYRA